MQIEVASGSIQEMDVQALAVAVFKDENGNVEKHSAVCTHQGCIVGWNDGEKTWDCPCHGSRFDKNGVVINGPAEKNLDEI